MIFFALASLSMAVVTALHVVGGSREVLRPVQRAGLAAMVHGSVAVMFHLITVQFVFSFCVLAWAAASPSFATSAHGVVILAMVAGYLGLCALLFLTYSLAVLRSPLAVPQWILLAPPAIFAALGIDAGLLGAMVAFGAAAALAAVAVVHVLWALGKWWPKSDEAELVRLVVGSRRGHMPPAWMSLAVAASLALAAGLVLLVYVDPTRVPQARWLLLASAAVFLLRGVGGYLEGTLRPSVRELPYYTANRRFYSPLCLLLALAVGSTALA